VIWFLVGVPPFLLYEFVRFIINICVNRKTYFEVHSTALPSAQFLHLRIWTAFLGSECCRGNSAIKLVVFEKECLWLTNTHQHHNSAYSRPRRWICNPNQHLIAIYKRYLRKRFFRTLQRKWSVENSDLNVICHLPLAED
jgi:hypothetical protein